MHVEILFRIAKDMVVCQKSLKSIRECIQESQAIPSLSMARQDDLFKSQYATLLSFLLEDEGIQGSPSAQKAQQRNVL